MTNQKVKYSIMTAEDEERINYLMPDIVLAVEALQLATADRIHRCLTECDIKATPSQIIMALEYACRLGLMEERTRYRLNPDLLNRTNCFVECPSDPNERVQPPCCVPQLKRDPCLEECDDSKEELIRDCKRRMKSDCPNGRS